MAMSKERAFIESIRKYLDSLEFTPSFVGVEVSNLRSYHQERLAEVIIYVIAHWYTAFLYGRDTAPDNVKELAFYLMAGFNSWKENGIHNEGITVWSDHVTELTKNDEH